MWLTGNGIARWSSLLVTFLMLWAYAMPSMALAQSTVTEITPPTETIGSGVETFPAQRPFRPRLFPRRPLRDGIGGLFGSRSRVVPSPDDAFAMEDAQAVILVEPGGACVDCRSRFWARGELGLWWIEGFHVPPLVTTSTTGTARDDAGVLGEPATTVLFGGDRLSDNPQLAGRVSLGGWFGPDRRNGVEVVAFTMTQPQPGFRATSSGDPILARPFFNVEPGSEGQDAELTAFPGELEGTITVSGETTFYGGELLYRRALSESCLNRFDFVAGWRYNRLDEDLVINDSKTVLSGATGLAVGTTLSEVDRFRTENDFHGGEVGFIYERRWCKWSLEGLIKVALGNTHSQASISGSTTVTVPVPGGPDDVTTTQSGLLAQQSNSGTFEQDDFAAIPELGMNVWYEVLPNLRAGVGYTFIYWSRVARPGDQIDTDLNLSQLSPGGLNGISRPEFEWEITDLWVQGINAGVDYRF